MLSVATALILLQAPTDKPDPVALLRGVEQARLAVVSGRFAYHVRLSGAGPALRSGPDSNVTVLFDREKRSITEVRRILVIEPPNERAKTKTLAGMNYDRDEFVRLGLGAWQQVRSQIILDGAQEIATEDPATGATLDSLPASYARSLTQSIDPRQLGLTVIGNPLADLSSILGLSTARAISCEGLDRTNGKDCWHVKMRLPGAENVERHFWIADTAGFPVHRLTVTQNGKLYSEVESEYAASNVKAVFPVRVRIRPEIDSRNVPRFECVIEERMAEYDPRLSPDSFSLSGLNLPIGAPVTDNRLKQIVGYWDGNKLVKDATAALRSRETSHLAAINVWLWVAVSSVVAVAIIVGAWHCVVKRRAEVG